MQQGGPAGLAAAATRRGPTTHLAHSDIAQGLLAVGGGELLQLLLLQGHKLPKAVLELQGEGGRGGGDAGVVEGGAGSLVASAWGAAARTRGPKKCRTRTVDANLPAAGAVVSLRAARLASISERYLVHREEKKVPLA